MCLLDIRRSWWLRIRGTENGKRRKKATNPLISLKDLRAGICICVAQNILDKAAGMGGAMGVVPPRWSCPGAPIPSSCRITFKWNLSPGCLFSLGVFFPKRILIFLRENPPQVSRVHRSLFLLHVGEMNLVVEFNYSQTHTSIENSTQWGVPFPIPPQNQESWNYGMVWGKGILKPA